MAGAEKIHSEDTQVICSPRPRRHHRHLIPHSPPLTHPLIISIDLRDFGFGKAGMEGLINEEVAMFIEEVRKDIQKV